MRWESLENPPPPLRSKGGLKVLLILLGQGHADAPGILAHDADLAGAGILVEEIAEAEVEVDQVPLPKKICKKYASIKQLKQGFVGLQLPWPGASMNAETP